MGLPEQPWPTGLCEELEPLVARVLAPNASPFTYTGTQTYLVGNRSDVAVIDPGPDEEEHLSALYNAIGERKISAIMCTHTHRDHSPAAAPLSAKTGAPIIGCAPLQMEDFSEEALKSRADAPFDKSYTPDRVLSDGEQVCGDGWSLTALATPGHTSNHLCYHLEESGAVFTGDHVMGWSTSVVAPPDGDMRDYLNSLERLYTREDRIYYPAHGPAITKPKQFVRGMIGHRRARSRQIIKLITQEPRAIQDLVPLMYKCVHERLWPAAGMSVLAHLIDLENQGQASRNGDIWSPI